MSCTFVKGLTERMWKRTGKPGQETARFCRGWRSSITGGGKTLAVLMTVLPGSRHSASALLTHK